MKHSSHFSILFFLFTKKKSDLLPPPLLIASSWTPLRCTIESEKEASFSSNRDFPQKKRLIERSTSNSDTGEGASVEGFDR
jgi:hypothetical protein